MAEIESVGRLRYDEVIIEKIDGDAELTIKNSTRNVIGFLKNIGDGVTQFVEVSDAASIRSGNEI